MTTKSRKKGQIAHSCAARAPLNAGQKSSRCSHVIIHCFKRPNEACNLCLPTGKTAKCWGTVRHCSTPNVVSTHTSTRNCCEIAITLIDPSFGRTNGARWIYKSIKGDVKNIILPSPEARFWFATSSPLSPRKTLVWGGAPGFGSALFHLISSIFWSRRRRSVSKLSSRAVVRCQPRIYLRLGAYGFFGLSEGA